MTAAQVAVATLTGVMIVMGSILIWWGDTSAERITGTVLIIAGLVGYIMLLGMIAQDRREG